MEKDSSQYIFKRNWESQGIMEKVIYSEDGLPKKVLKWIAGTLDSEDAFIFSWPDEEDQMQIHESVISTPGLKLCKTIICFERLKNWLSSTDESLVLNNTSGIEGFQKIHIKSPIAIKIETKEEGFRAKQILLVCNRKNPAAQDHMYISFDRFFCHIAQWIIQLHTSELFKLKNTRYNDAKERYKYNKIISSLILLGKTSNELLELYNQYSAEPPLRLLYDCLDTHIALFNAGQKEKKEFIELLEKCKKYWFEGIDKPRKIDPNFVRYALARGYFALGVHDNRYWLAGKNLLD